MDSWDYNRKRRLLFDIYMHLVETLSVVLDSIGARFWLWGGSLLGAVRNGMSIPWDSDVDVCVLGKDIGRILSAKWPPCVAIGRTKTRGLFTLSRTGTSMVNYRNIPKWRAELSNGFPVGIHIDIFPIVGVPECRSEAEEYLKKARGVPFRELSKKYTDSGFMSTIHSFDHHIPVDALLSESKMVMFEGVKVPIMSGYDTVLRNKYGDDYLTPKNWRHHHKIYVDFVNGYEMYARGEIKLPDPPPRFDGVEIEFSECDFDRARDVEDTVHLKWKMGVSP